MRETQRSVSAGARFADGCAAEPSDRPASGCRLTDGCAAEHRGRREDVRTPNIRATSSASQHPNATFLLPSSHPLLPPTATQEQVRLAGAVQGPHGRLWGWHAQSLDRHTLAAPLCVRSSCPSPHNSRPLKMALPQRLPRSKTVQARRRSAHDTAPHPPCCLHAPSGANADEKRAPAMRLVVADSRRARESIFQSGLGTLFRGNHPPITLMLRRVRLSSLCLPALGVRSMAVGTVHVLYGSQTGTAEFFAGELSEELKSAGYGTRLSDQRKVTAVGDVSLVADVGK